MEQGRVVIEAELETKTFDAQIEYIENKMLEIEEKLKQADMGFEVGDTSKLEVEYEKLGNQLLTLKGRQEQYNQSITETKNIDFTNMKKSIDSVGNSVSGIIKKVSKWGLAIFGIRSAYLFVRQAMSTLTENDNQLKADIDYMKTALAYAIEPIVRKIVELAKYLLQLVGFIVYKLSGKNIFAGANKNLKSANQEATKLSKTIAGFDEMNVLQSTSTGGGGGVGDLTPSFNLGDYTEIEKMIGKITQKVKELDDEMDRALYHTDFDIWTNAFGEWDVAVFGVTQTIHGLFGQAKSMIGTVKGLWEVLHGTITGDEEEVKKGFEDLYKNVKEWVRSTVEIFTGAGNTIKGIAKGIIENTWGWLINLYNRANNKLNEFRDNIVNVWTQIRDRIKQIIQNIQSWLVTKFGSFGRTIGDVVGSYFKAVINMALSMIERILNKPINAVNYMIDRIRSIVPIRISKLSTYSFPRLAKGGLVNNPGNGVFMGNYVAGERGPEAVLPLTDEVFDRLGLAIGRHTSINATIPVYAYNRQVAREIRRIEASQSFATNGR